MPKKTPRERPTWCRPTHSSGRTASARRGAGVGEQGILDPFEHGEGRAQRPPLQRCTDAVRAKWPPRGRHRGSASRRPRARAPARASPRRGGRRTAVEDAGGRVDRQHVDGDEAERRSRARGHRCCSTPAGRDRISDRPPPRSTTKRAGAARSGGHSRTSQRGRAPSLGERRRQPREHRQCRRSCRPHRPAPRRARRWRRVRSVRSRRRSDRRAAPSSRLSAGDPDGRDREPGVEDGDDAERERHRPRQVDPRAGGSRRRAARPPPSRRRARRGCWAAVPTAHQPCGANGVQLSPPFDGGATVIATAITTISTDESPS